MNLEEEWHQRGTWDFHSAGGQAGIQPGKKATVHSLASSDWINSTVSTYSHQCWRDRHTHIHREINTPTTFSGSVLKLSVMVRNISQTRSKLLINHNTLIQPTNQSTVCFSEGGAIETGTKQSVTDRLGWEEML